MASLNQCQFIGNLGADPEMRATPGGQNVCQFRLACTESWKDKEGKKQERTEWVRVVAWGKLAELCNQYLAKGRQTFVSGRMQTREWTDKEGQRRWTTEIVASDVVFLGSGNGASKGRDMEPPPPTNGHAPPMPAGADDEPPF